MFYNGPAVAQRMTTNATVVDSFPIRGLPRIRKESTTVAINYNYLIFSFSRTGNKTKRGVELRHETQCLENFAKN